MPRGHGGREAREPLRHTRPMSWSLLLWGRLHLLSWCLCLCFATPWSVRRRAFVGGLSVQQARRSSPACSSCHRSSRCIISSISSSSSSSSSSSRSQLVLAFFEPPSSPSRSPSPTEVRPGGEKEPPSVEDATKTEAKANEHAVTTELNEEHMTSTLLDEVEGSVVVSNDDIAIDHHRRRTQAVAVLLLTVTAALGVLIGMASLQQQSGLLLHPDDAATTVAGPGAAGQLPLLQALAPPTFSLQKSLLAGAGAGISRGLSRVLTFPLDTIKTRQQAVLTTLGHEAEGEGVVVERAKAVHKGRLFDGLLPMLLIAGPANAAFFVTYDYLGAVATALGLAPRTHWYVELGAALLASMPANVVRIPAEVAKQRVQAGLEARAWDAVLDLWRAEGLLGLYVGGGAHLLRELPFNMVQFLAFRNLKEAFAAASASGGGPVGVGVKALLGALAAGIASLATQPLDTIKTGQMLDRGGRGSTESYADGVQRIYQRFGLAGLYLGAMPRLGLCAIGGAAYFLANELIMDRITSGVPLLPPH